MKMRNRVGLTGLCMMLVALPGELVAWPLR